MPHRSDLRPVGYFLSCYPTSSHESNGIRACLFSAMACSRVGILRPFRMAQSCCLCIPQRRASSAAVTVVLLASHFKTASDPLFGLLSKAPSVASVSRRFS